MKPTEPVWSNFLCVNENRSAVRAVRRLLRAVTESKTISLSFLPLYLHGPAGGGKSALLKCMTQAIVESPTGRTLSTIFANDIEPRRQDDETEADSVFWERATVDVLLLEDLQYLPERAASWFERLLDTRHTHRRPTICTGNVGPAALRNLPRRVTSRLSAGLVVPFEPYSPESRLKILKAAALRDALSIDSAAMKWIADRPTGGGLRPLLGILQTLKNQTRNPLQPWTIDDITAVLEESPPGFDVNLIIQRVAVAFGVKEKDIRGTSRLKTVMLARQTAMHLAREIGKLSLPALGRIFERDHSSVLHSLRKIEQQRANDTAFQSQLDALQSELM